MVCVNQCWRGVIVNLAVVRGIRRPIGFTTKILVADENTVRHTNIPKIIIALYHWQAGKIRTLLVQWERAHLPEYTHTEKYATTCHFLISLVPGRWTVTEYVCFVSPFGFDGLSFLLTGGGMITLGSDARHALIMMETMSYRNFWPGESVGTYRRAALASLSSWVVSIFSS